MALQMRRTDEYRGKIKLIKIVSSDNTEKILYYEKRLLKVNEDLKQFDLNTKIYHLQQQRGKQTYLINIENLTQDQQYAYIRMQYCQKSLQDYVLKNKNQITIPKIKKWFIQIMVAVMHLNELGISHRDIKLSNILLTASQDVRLIDFGVSRQFTGQQMQTTVGSRDYCAPQMVGPYNNKINIFSIGICLLFLSEKISKLNIKKQQLENYEFSQQTPESLRDLILKAVRIEPDMRINWLQLSQHQFFLKNDCQKQQQLRKKCEEFYKPLYQVINKIEIIRNLQYLIEEIIFAKDDFFTYQDSNKLPMIARAKCLYFLLNEYIQIKNVFDSLTVPEHLYFYVRKLEKKDMRQYILNFQIYQEYLTNFYLSTSKDPTTQLNDLCNSQVSKIQLLYLAKDITKFRPQNPSYDHFSIAIERYAKCLNKNSEIVSSIISEQIYRDVKKGKTDKNLEKEQDLGVIQTVLKPSDEL